MWKVEYKKRFLKELSKLPEDIQAQAEKIAFEDLICENPFPLARQAKLGYFCWVTGYAVPVFHR